MSIMNNIKQMSTTKKVILGSVLSLGIIGSATAMMKPHHGHFGGYMIYKLEKKLDLNETQVSQLEAIQKSFKEKREAFSKANPDPRQQVMEMLKQPTLDQQKVMEMVNKRTQVMQAEAPAMVAQIAQFTDSLTPEQRTELTEMLEKFGHHRGGKHGHGYGRD